MQRRNWAQSNSHCRFTENRQKVYVIYVFVYFCLSSSCGKVCLLDAFHAASTFTHPRPWISRFSTWVKGVQEMAKYVVLVAVVIASLVVVDSAEARRRCRGGRCGSGGCSTGNCAVTTCPGGVCAVEGHSAQPTTTTVVKTQTKVESGVAAAPAQTAQQPAQYVSYGRRFGWRR